MLITINEIKKYLKLEDTVDEDILVETILNSAISYCEIYLKRPVLDANMTEDTQWEVSEEIRIAVYMLVTHWYENRSPVTVGVINRELELGVKNILNPHKFRQV